ncbi:hypothetical protein Droror1_Dr00010720 [Drosera rotundifolia]
MPRNALALAANIITSGMPSSFPAPDVNPIAASAMMQETGGTPEVAVSLSLERSSLNRPPLVISMEMTRVVKSCVTSSLSAGGRPSGNWNRLKPERRKTIQRMLATRP